MSLVGAQGWGWRYAGRTAWAVRDLDLTIEDGERVLLLGPSGAGKSTLLAALAGVLGGADEGTEAGRLLVGGQHPTRRVGQVGLVQQDPQSQIVLARVGDDVAFGCENKAMPRERIWPRVREALAAVGLGVGVTHLTSALSGGQQQRLVLAGTLAMRDGGVDDPAHPRLLLLDEPTANLDPQGVTEVRDAVGRLVADRTTTLIIVEHRVEAWLELIDRVIVLSPEAGVMADGPPAAVFAARGRELANRGVWVPGVPLPVLARLGGAPGGGAEAVLRGVDLTIGYEATHVVRDHLDVVIPGGLSTVITGPNGVGKSTLALTLAGLLPQLGGRVEAADGLIPPATTRRQRRLAGGKGLGDPHTWTSAQLLTRIGTVFQEPEHQFVTADVRSELAVGLRALRWPEEMITRRVDELLALLQLDALAGVNPFTLSGGEKRRLSVGTVLAGGPSVIILDEPTFGQDRATWCALVELIMRLLDEGRTVVSVTHDPAYLDLLGEHRIELGVRR